MAADTPYAPLTVAAALAEAPLSTARLVAGERGLSRAVRGVGVLDVGDVGAVTQDQLVLSSAYPLVSIDAADLVERLVQRSACAFGVKTEGYWPEMPRRLSAAADALGLPLLELPSGPFDELVNPVLALIADRQADGLRRAAELEEALTRAVLAEVGLGAVATTVSRSLGRPTAVIDEHGHVLADAGIEDGAPPKTLADEAAALRGVGRGRLVGREWLLAPISALGRFYGAVCVSVGEFEDAFMRAAVAEAATVAGMLLVGNRRIDAVHRRFERELLDDLVDSRALDAAQTAERARRIGWPQRRPYLVLVVGRRRQGASPLGPILDVGVDDETTTAVRRAVRDLPFQVRLFPHRPGLCAIVHLDDHSQARAAADTIARRLPSSSADGASRGRLVAGVARPRTAVTALPEAFREAALTALTCPRIRTGATPLSHFADLGPARLAAAVEDRRSLETMVADLLDPLTDRELSGGHDLLQTLAALLDHNMSISDTAEELFFHYNTVRHRLGRLRELLGERLSTPAGRTSLALAIGGLRVLRCEGEMVAGRPGARPAAADLALAR